MKVLIKSVIPQWIDTTTRLSTDDEYTYLGGDVKYTAWIGRAIVNGSIYLEDFDGRTFKDMEKVVVRLLTEEKV